MARVLCEVSEVKATGLRGFAGSQDAQASRLPGGGEGRALGEGGTAHILATGQSLAQTAGK